MSTEIRERPRRFWRVLAAAFVLIAVAGCAGGDSDERRTAALGEGEAEALSWRGDWTAEAEYQPGEVVTHEGGTFVAVTPTTGAPDAKCETGCAWNVIAESGAATINTDPPPPPKIQVFEYTTGYDGPVDLPPTDQQAVNAWLADVAPHVIRHRDENGTILGEKLMEVGGNYLVFARAIVASAPGLGKTPIPQTLAPSLGAMVSAGFNIGGIIGGPLKDVLKQTFGQVNSGLLNALRGTGASGPAQPEYSVSCTLRANRQPIDTASMSISERGTASTSLMGFMISPADVKFDVGCAHNGEKAGPFVRDLRLVVVKFP